MLAWCMSSPPCASAKGTAPLRTASGSIFHASHLGLLICKKHCASQLLQGMVCTCCSTCHSVEELITAGGATVVHMLSGLTRHTVDL